MADKPVGTIFVELDLDASRYTRGQQKLLKDAQSTTLNIEQNFKNLGIKSSAEMDLMRAKIKNSFDMIANSSKATANDIIRAEEAKNAKLKALNDKQFGEQKSLLENLKSNWIAASVAIFAAYRAIGQAVEMAKAGAMLEKQADAFRNLATAAGTSSTRVIASLKAVSGGMVAEADLMAAAGKAMLMSIPADKITELMKIAAATSRMTGQTITDAFNDITMGVARQSKMILDNLGIIVNVDKANQDYARALGRTADSLTDTERRQAFMNATLAAGNEMITRLGEQQGALDGVNKMVAAQADLWAEVNRTVAQMLDKELTAYAKMLNWIADKLKSMRASAGESSRADMAKEIEMLRSLESKGMVQPGTTMAKMAEFNRRYLGASESELANQAAYKEWQKPDQFASWREREGNWAANTEEENKKILKAAEDARKKFEEAAKKSSEVNKTFWEAYKRDVEGAIEFEKFKLDEQYKAFDQYVRDKVALNEWYQAERRKIEIKEYAETAATQFPAEHYGIEAARARAYAANEKSKQESAKAIEEQRAAMAKADEIANEERWWKTYIEGTEDATRANEIFTDSMDIMAQSAADAFAEFVTGTKSAKDAFTQMAQSMISAMARITAQRGFEQLFGLIAAGAGSLFSGWGAGTTPTGMGTNTTFAGGGTMGGYMGMVKHAGGLMTESGPARRVPAMVFANAPRYHGGLAHDEMAAILKKDEGVFTPGQMKALGSRSTTINVPVSVVERNPKMHSELRREVELTVEKVIRRYS